MTPTSSMSRLRKESLLARRIPYTAQVSEHVVRTRYGHFVQVVQVGGASFECADDADINVWHERLNVLWRNLASSNVAVWTHIIRRREQTYPGGSFVNPFAAVPVHHGRGEGNVIEFDTVYRECFPRGAERHRPFGKK